MSRSGRGLMCSDADCWRDRAAASRDVGNKELGCSGDRSGFRSLGGWPREIASVADGGGRKERVPVTLVEWQNRFGFGKRALLTHKSISDVALSPVLLFLLC